MRFGQITTEFDSGGHLDPGDLMIALELKGVHHLAGTRHTQARGLCRNLADGLDSPRKVRIHIEIKDHQVVIDQCLQTID